jgi:hypothetical protein
VGLLFPGRRVPDDEQDGCCLNKRRLPIVLYALMPFSSLQPKIIRYFSGRPESSFL